MPTIGHSSPREPAAEVLLWPRPWVKQATSVTSAAPSVSSARAHTHQLRQTKALVCQDPPYPHSLKWNKNITHGGWEGSLLRRIVRGKKHGKIKNETRQPGKNAEPDWWCNSGLATDGQDNASADWLFQKTSYRSNTPLSMLRDQQNCRWQDTAIDTKHHPPPGKRDQNKESQKTKFAFD